MKPPEPKKADWPNDSRPVNPNRRSKPRPNRPPDQDLVHRVGCEAKMRQHVRRHDEAERGEAFDEEGTAPGTGSRLQSRLRRPIRPRGRISSTRVIAANSMT